jgi:hypothetical protein
MPSLNRAGSGRHRGTTSPVPSLFAGLRQQPSHRSALKGLGLVATALGVATAFTAPGPETAAAFQLTTRAAAAAPVEATAAALPAPARAESYGEIGFGAAAVPKPKPKAKPKPTATRSTGTPTREAARGVSRNTSRSGLANVGGMTPNAIAVINAVKAEFPGSGPFGGYRPGDPLDHGSGHAVDIMCGIAEGDRIAAFLQANAGTLNIKYLIWKQRIWYPGSGGWQGMEDRGGATANHFDHVHVSVT